jgi:hypothetical protein
MRKSLVFTFLNVRTAPKLGKPMWLQNAWTITGAAKCPEKN